MIYIIDHQDSFTWNVVHQFSQFDEIYCSNYFNLNKKLPKLNHNVLPVVGWVQDTLPNFLIENKDKKIISIG